MRNILKTNKSRIFTSDNKFINLRGVNFGGWLMMEAYILLAPNRAEQLFKKHFAKILWKKTLQEFEHAFRSTFIQEQDFKNVKEQGFNCIRLPFNYRLVQDKPYQFNQQGLKILDQAFLWAAKYQIYVILDLHAAPGAQNYDWHSDSLGKAELWTKPQNRKQTFALWEFLANRYKDQEYLAGYDLLNEAVLGDTKLLNEFYQQAIAAIRRADKNHILFIEGSRWAQDLETLDEFKDNNYALSIHNYEPLCFTFNFVTNMHYPIKSGPHRWDGQMMRRHLMKSKKIADGRQVPLFVGEFGVNARDGFYVEDKWLNETLKCYNDLGLHWTYWTYKAIKNFVHPDGVYSYTENPPWVNRSGPMIGWETFHLHWKERKKEMMESWKTKNFSVNKKVLEALRKYAK